jgi:hypothetical protein
MHVLCQVEDVARLLVVSTEVNLDVLPRDVNLIGVSSSACP